jgi:hypothetical protein
MAEYWSNIGGIKGPFSVMNRAFCTKNHRYGIQVPESAPSVEKQAVILKAGKFGCLGSCCARPKLAPATGSEAGKVPLPATGSEAGRAPLFPNRKQEKKKIIAMCESEADAIKCFASFRACKIFVVDMITFPLT